MKQHLSIFLLLLCAFSATSQTAITGVNTTPAAAAAPTTYMDGGDTYNWGVPPNNTEQKLTDFTVGATQYFYAAGTPGTVKLRRVDNTANTGNITLVWVESVTSPLTYSMLPEYQNDLEAFLNNNIYNKGADNLFDNTALNSNNIERFDWILSTPYSTSTPAGAGFPVFDRGPVGNHDAFCIAAITALDGSGNPATYSGNIVRVASGDYGDFGSPVTYTVLKGTPPANLLAVVPTASQPRGGVFISLQDLGIGAGTIIYGYSLFSPDLPVGATLTDLVDYSNTAFFPTNTGSSGGIELVAVSGLAATAAVLPTRFTTFDAVEDNDIVNLKWSVENESTLDRYEIERSNDGINFIKINEIKSAGIRNYTLPDNISTISSPQIYYRIKQYDVNGSYYYSKTVAIKRNKNASIIVYPNPAIKALYVNIKSTVNDKGVVSITNSTGAEVIRQPVQLANGNNSITIEKVIGLPRGIYQLSVKLNSGKTIIKQFSKQ